MTKESVLSNAVVATSEDKLDAKGAEVGTVPELILHPNWDTVGDILLLERFAGDG